MGTTTLADVILYIVAGFVFIQIFNFIVSNQSPNDFQHVFFKSLIAGYIFVNGIHLIPIHMNNIYWDIAIVLCMDVVASYIFAQVYSSSQFNTVLKTLNIRRTVNPYIWNDIEDKDETLWVHVGLKNSDVQYMGVLACIEDFQRQPIIVLSNYSTCKYGQDIYGADTKDFTTDSRQRVVVNTAEADYIKLIYDENSKKIFQMNKKSDKQDHS